MSSVLVSVEGLRKTFRVGFTGRKRVEALQGIDFTVRRGSLFGFLGPNGAGKSTTIKTMAGLLYPTAGSIQILGGSPSDVAVRRRYGFLPENPSFHENLTGREILKFLGALVGMRGPALKKRADELLELTKLTRAADLQVRRYSKGMVQRLGIAQALLHDPELVILDEPMSGLDPIGRREVRDIILELKSRGKTVFFSTHIISDVEHLCDDVVILLRGKVARSGAVQDLIGSGPKLFELRAADVPADFDPGNARTVGGHDVFLVDDDAAARELMERLWRVNARVRALNVRHYSLEDLFLAEVGRDAVGGAVTSD